MRFFKIIIILILISLILPQILAYNSTTQTIQFTDPSFKPIKINTHIFLSDNFHLQDTSDNIIPENAIITNGTFFTIVGESTAQQNTNHEWFLPGGSSDSPPIAIVTTSEKANLISLAESLKVLPVNKSFIGNGVYTGNRDFYQWTNKFTPLSSFYREEDLEIESFSIPFSATTYVYARYAWPCFLAFSPGYIMQGAKQCIMQGKLGISIFCSVEENVTTSGPATCTGNNCQATGVGDITITKNKTYDCSGFLDRIQVTNFSGKNFETFRHSFDKPAEFEFNHLMNGNKKATLTSTYKITSICSNPCDNPGTTKCADQHTQLTCVNKGPLCNQWTPTVCTNSQLCTPITNTCEEKSNLPTDIFTIDDIEVN